MKNLSSNEVRQLWLDFFKTKGHKVEPGASLIPIHDPTLLWINSGVAALKKYFDGSEIPPSRRIVNVQKAIRTNDIENVGHTARHHTFFEMLGCFSIGDYFRKEIIAWAVEILTSSEWFDMPIDKLYMTYHPSDGETKKLWMANGVKEDHLIPLENNFWQIGEGPCGPNTEVFFDRGEKWDPQHLGVKLLHDEIENDRYIEIWGIVFSQYNAVEGVARENFKELPSKNIDTGAGLERITCILQNKDTNFETDLFWPIIQKTEKLSNKKYNSNPLAFRVIADHIRAITFALADGEMFSNEGRGYVLRRLLRRAVRYGNVLGLHDPFLYKLVDVVRKQMSTFYPYLNEHVSFISKVVEQEEKKFFLTLEKGEAILKQIVGDTNRLSGKEAFRLYDTFGFPLELTKEICQEKNIIVDEEGFQQEMEKQKQRARDSRKNVQSMHKQSESLLACTMPSEFTYGLKPIEARVIALFEDGQSVNSSSSQVEIMFDKTIFYAESGGQVSDIGEFKGENFEGRIAYVYKAPNKQHLHVAQMFYGTISVGDKVLLKLDEQRRLKIMRNHSATHLLQSAIEDVLGQTINQQGSFVCDEYIHFDFNHLSKISDQELGLIEEKVNQWIAQAIPMETKVLPIEEAKKLGAKSLFNDKYGDVVRVVSFEGVSSEFCGGTHVPNTQDIGFFAIEFEESIAAGIRRIQARTSTGAYDLYKKKNALLRYCGEQLAVSSAVEIPSRLSTVLKEKENMKKIITNLRSRVGTFVVDKLESANQTKDGVMFFVSHLKDMDRNALMYVLDNMKSTRQNYFVLLIGEDSTNNTLPVMCAIKGEPLKKGYKAGVIVKEVCSILGGNGGGKDDFAQGSGKNRDKIEKAIDAARELVKNV